jgi:hypothetical protein
VKHRLRPYEVLALAFFIMCGTHFYKKEITNLYKIKSYNI